MPRPRMPHRAHYTALRTRAHLCTSRSIRMLRACARLRASLVMHTCMRTCNVAWIFSCLLSACTEVARLAVAFTRAVYCLSALLSERSRRAGIHARCFGPTSEMGCMLTLLLLADKTTNEMTTNEMTTSEMTTSEMTTSETSKTSEKKYQTSGCACGPKNCETKRPSAQARDPKSSKPHELKRAKNCATYSGTRTRCVRPSRRARRSPRSTTGRSCAHPPGTGRRRPRCSRTRR